MEAAEKVVQKNSELENNFLIRYFFLLEYVEKFV